MMEGVIKMNNYRRNKRLFFEMIINLKLSHSKSKFVLDVLHAHFRSAKIKAKAVSGSDDNLMITLTLDEDFVTKKTSFDDVKDYMICTLDKFLAFMNKGDDITKMNFDFYKDLGIDPKIYNIEFLDSKFTIFYKGKEYNPKDVNSIINLSSLDIVYGPDTDDDDFDYNDKDTCD